MSFSPAPMDPHDAPRPGASVSVCLAVLAGLAAAWVAAGSAGMMAHALRHALTWAALGAAVVAAWPRGRRGLRAVLPVAGACALALGMSISAHPVPNVLAVALVLAALAWNGEGLARRALTLAALAAMVLAVYRLAVVSIPAVWLLTDWLGGRLGALGGWVTGRPLDVGATFGGLDYLVLMGAFYGLWLAATEAPRRERALWAGAAILLGHVFYLAVLSFAADLISALPDPPPPPDYHVYLPPPWSWSRAAGAMLPWNVPLVALAVHLATAAAMLRWAAWRADEAPRPAPERQDEPAPLDQIAAEAGPFVLAAAVPLLVVLSLASADLSDRKIVAYGEGRLDWKKPEHGHYRRADVGLFGMLPELVGSLGGRFSVSEDLAEGDLRDADVLVLLHPCKPWTEDKEDKKDKLKQIDEFVRRGGALLVAADCRVREGDAASTFNEVLSGTGMEVRYDAAIYETAHWQEALHPIAHPAATGIGDARNRFGIASGSSIALRWPARPVLAGAFGYSDPGSDAMLTGQSRYDAGERLGDLVLAAEQRWGDGTILVLGDAGCLANETLPLSYPFVSRLLGYLAGQPGNPQAWWRQALGLAACALLVGLLAWRPRPEVIGAAALAMALVLALCVSGAERAGRALPGAKGMAGATRLAYVDASHVEAYSDRTWSDDGLGGLFTVLMQNGYLPLFAPDLSKERLGPASLLVSVAPARRFSGAELEAVRGFVENGGLLVATAGAEDAAALRPLLEPFGLRIPRSPVGPGEAVREPEPVAESPSPGEPLDNYGRIRTYYLSAKDYGAGDYRVAVSLYAPWPVDADGGDAQVLARGYGNVPLAIHRQAGGGGVVVVGDTYFAANKNFGYARGEPSDATIENAHFWRWMLTRTARRAEWVPPDPAQRGPAAEKPGPDNAAPHVRRPLRAKAPAKQEAAP